MTYKIVLYTCIHCIFVQTKNDIMCIESTVELRITYMYIHVLVLELTANSPHYTANMGGILLFVF